MRAPVVAVLLSLAWSTGLAAQAARGDEWLRKPVDEPTFRTFLSFFSYDRSLPLAVQKLETDEYEGITREHLSFASTPGQRVTARAYRAAAAAGAKSGWIVFIHGGTGPGKDAQGNRFLQGFLARAGWNVIGFDLQYFGERRSDLLTSFSELEKHEKLYNQPSAMLAWIAQTVKDAGRTIDYLIQEQGADPRRIALVGFSRGAQMAYIIGAADKRFAAVAAAFGGHFDANETGHLPAACPANYVGRISPRPFLMMNGSQDEDYNRETSVLPLYQIARNPKQQVWLDTGHVVPPAEQLPQLTRWLAEHVK